MKKELDECADKIIPAEIANEMLLTIIATINAKLYEIEKDDPEEIRRLDELCFKVKKLKNQIRTYTYNPDFNNQVIEGWSPAQKPKTMKRTFGRNLM